ncbi:MAG: signal peptidase II [Bacteriovoracaceae bacterium]|nr:signal peptidase II [Bacteriovoracaceae bacterium]
MKKRSLTPPMVLVGLSGLDVITKKLAVSTHHYWANPGVMLGFLADLPPLMLILSLSALSAFLFLIYVCLQLFLHPKLLGLKLSISFLTAGIIGNVIDKVLYGWTVDWIVFPLPQSQNVAFNLADAFLWIGIFSVVWWMFKKEDEIWYPGDQRQNIWHHPKEQLLFSLKFVVFVSAMCAMLGFFSYAFIQQILLPIPGDLGGVIGRQYLIVLMCLSLLFVAISFIVGVWISHRMIGPVVAFERHIEGILAGKNKEFRLREGDMLKKLEEIAQLVAKLSILFLLLLPKAWAYPQYIGLQYTSCLTCHYNPQGNGPLNDYGRAVGATAVAGRLFVDKDVSEEQLGKDSAFPGIDVEKNTWFRPMLSYRGLGYDSNAFTSQADKEWINMQLDANVVLKAGDRDQYVASFTLGTRPTNTQAQNNLKESQSYSREHYLGWRPTAKMGIYAGKMDKAFGLRIPDHNLSSRRSTRAAQFNQIHGVMVHAVGESLEASAHYFVGDLSEKDKDLRDKGYSGIVEWGVTSRQRLGASYMSSKITTETINVMSIHDRIGFGKGHAVMGEFGQINRQPQSGSKTSSRYGLLQTYLQWFRGFSVTGTLDYYRRDITKDEESMSVGPGIQYFPRQKTELRLDVLNNRSFSESTAAKDTWQVLAQVHLWL